MDKAFNNNVFDDVVRAPIRVRKMRLDRKGGKI